MRLGLPRWILLSIALHGGILTILLLLLRSHDASSSPFSDPTDSPSLSLLLSSEDVPNRHLPVLDSLRAGKRAEVSPTSVPLSPFAEVKTATAAAPAPTLALKSTLNIHVRMPDESVLSPAVTPILNSHDGIVFLLDISGSMYEPYLGATRLAFARQVLAGRIRALRNGAPFAIVVYGERARRSGPLVPANDATREAAVKFINRDYDCGGGTDLPTGLDLAEDLNMGSLLLVTDGDLNMAESELLLRVRRILGDAGTSPPLTIIGIAPRGQTKDSALLQSLADHQHGTYQIAKTTHSADLLTANKPDGTAP